VVGDTDMISSRESTVNTGTTCDLCGRGIEQDFDTTDVVYCESCALLGYFEYEPKKEILEEDKIGWSHPMEQEDKREGRKPLVIRNYQVNRWRGTKTWRKRR